VSRHAAGVSYGFGSVIIAGSRRRHFYARQPFAPRITGEKRAAATDLVAHLDRTRQVPSSPLARRNDARQSPDPVLTIPDLRPCSVIIRRKTAHPYRR
jgi:hypothetical protein